MSMQAIQPSAVTHSLFTDFAETDGPFERALQVMQLLAVSGAGLGEVLPDYAMQTGQQMEELMHD
jgi:hypothetical protein